MEKLWKIGKSVPKKSSSPERQNCFFQLCLYFTCEYFKILAAAFLQLLEQLTFINLCATDTMRTNGHPLHCNAMHCIGAWDIMAFHKSTLYIVHENYKMK